jgi:hypothetical protein
VRTTPPAIITKKQRINVAKAQRLIDFILVLQIYSSKNCYHKMNCFFIVLTDIC